MAAPNMNLDSLFAGQPGFPPITSGTGAGLIPYKSPIATTVASTVEAELARVYNVENFGATTASANCSANFKAAGLAVSNAGGGIIKIGPGVWRTCEVPLYANVHWIGSGHGTTTLKQPDGTNKDMVVSNNFATLTKVGPAGNPLIPSNFSMSNLTVDGNYLTDFNASINGADTTTKNTSGYGFKIFGYKFNIDVELNNCAGVGFYSETASANDDVNFAASANRVTSKVRLYGNVFGKEAVYFRGPHGLHFEYLEVGYIGWSATNAARQADYILSDLHQTNLLNGVTIESGLIGTPNRYHQGVPTFDVIRVHHNLNGYGLDTRYTNSTTIGQYVYVEACRGGVQLNRSVIGTVVTRDCGVEATGKANNNAWGILVDADVRFRTKIGYLSITKSQTTQNIKTSLRAYGDHNDITMHYTVNGVVTNVGGDKAVEIENTNRSKFDLTFAATHATAVTLATAVGNDIRINANNVTSGVVLVRSPGCNNNTITINAENCATVYSSSVTAFQASTDDVSITAVLATGQVVFSASGSGDPEINKPKVNAIINGVQYTSKRAGTVALADVTTEQVITVTHGYFTTPKLSQISLTLIDPSPTATHVIEYLRLRSVSATQFVAVVKFSSVGTDGPLSLGWKLD